MIPAIMVQAANREWTMAALHCACLLARNMSARIKLVKMIPVQHPSWVGTEWGYLDFTKQEQADFEEYQATLEDYGVEYTPVLFQYLTLAEGIAEAADYVDAQIVYATIPESIIPLWIRFQRWMLGRQLARQERQWIQFPVYDSSASRPIPEAAAEIIYR